jgi:hypothetical protein
MSPVTKLMIPVAVFLAIQLADLAIKARLAYWQRRYVEAKEEQAPIDSESFDLSLRWAYVRGYSDAINRRDPNIGAEATILDHRTMFPRTSP